MTDLEETMLRAIKANRSEDSNRLIYADWLEEQGRTEEAEYLRLYVLLRGKTATSEEFENNFPKFSAMARSRPIAWRRRISSIGWRRELTPAAP